VDKRNKEFFEGIVCEFHVGELELQVICSEVAFKSSVFLALILQFEVRSAMCGKDQERWV
jgi:hypothetical protein